MFSPNHQSFFLSPNICPAALFEQGEEEATKNNVMLQPHNGRHLDFDFVYIDELNRYKVELAGCSKGGVPKLSNYPHRLGSLPAPGGRWGSVGECSGYNAMI